MRSTDSARSLFLATSIKRATVEQQNAGFCRGFVHFALSCIFMHFHAFSRASILKCELVRRKSAVGFEAWHFKLIYATLLMEVLRDLKAALPRLVTMTDLAPRPLVPQTALCALLWLSQSFLGMPFLWCCQFFGPCVRVAIQGLHLGSHAGSGHRAQQGRGFAAAAGRGKRHGRLDRRL